MAKLINGNGNPAVYAAEDADMLAGIMGNVTTITAVGNEFAATASGANLIEVADGVILTQEGRRIQLDAGLTDAFTIPSGTAGTTNYYIIGYRLYESASGTQECETFVQLMASASDTIPEATFRGGATEVFVSLYRVEQDGINLGTITLLLPKVSGVSQINEELSEKVKRYSGTASGKTYVTVDSIGYDSTNKTLGLKVNGADTVIPFSSGNFKYGFVFSGYRNNDATAKLISIFNGTSFSGPYSCDSNNPPSFNSTYCTRSATASYQITVTFNKAGYVYDMHTGIRNSISAGQSVTFGGLESTYKEPCIAYFS